MFCILAEPRSGSNLLQTTLAAHPEIEFLQNEPFGEPHQRKNGDPDLENPYDWVSSQFQRSNGIGGFRLLHCQPETGEARENLLRSMTMQKWKFVHLYRQNKFAQMVSHWSAQRSGHYIHQPYELEPFEVNSAKLRGHLAYTAHVDQAVREFLGSIPNRAQHVKLTYEALTGDLGGMVNQLCKFLRISPHPNPIPRIEKQMKCPPSEMLTNPTEVRAMVDEFFPEGWDVATKKN